MRHNKSTTHSKRSVGSCVQCLTSLLLCWQCVRSGMLQNLPIIANVLSALSIYIVQYTNYYTHARYLFGKSAVNVLYSLVFIAKLVALLCISVGCVVSEFSNQIPIKCHNIHKRARIF